MYLMVIFMWERDGPLVKLLQFSRVGVNLLYVSGSESEKAAFRLLAVSKLINQAVGDALSGLLLVEAILQHKHW